MVQSTHEKPHCFLGAPIGVLHHSTTHLQGALSNVDPQMRQTLGTFEPSPIGTRTAEGHKNGKGPDEPHQNHTDTAGGHTLQLSHPHLSADGGELLDPWQSSVILPSCQATDEHVDRFCSPIARHFMTQH